MKAQVQHENELSEKIQITSGMASMKLQTKISVYKPLILPVLFYGAETWCPYKADIRNLTHSIYVVLRRY